MAHPPTDAELLLLGLIAEEPRHGFDLEKVIEQRGMRRWTDIGFSSIYYVLGRLEQRGHARVRDIIHGGRGRPRKVYEITAQGRRVVADAALRALAEPRSGPAALLVAMANLALIDVDAARDALRRRGRALDDDLADLARAADHQHPVPPHVEAIFDHSRTMLAAERDWLDRTLTALAEEITVPPLDVKKAQKDLYAPPKDEFVIVDVPPMTFFAVDGHGDPNTSPDYVRALEALYSASYAVKFTSKREHGHDLVVPPLEGLWWAEDMTAFVSRDKAAWSWTMMIRQPDWMSDDELAAVAASTAAKKSLPASDLLRIVHLTEGPSAQILHVGSYDDEGPTLRRLYEEFVPRHGLALHGKHHEIYLSDARRVAPEKLKTVLRHPVRPASA